MRIAALDNLLSRLATGPTDVPSESASPAAPEAQAATEAESAPAKASRKRAAPSRSKAPVQTPVDAVEPKQRKRARKLIASPELAAPTEDMLRGAMVRSMLDELITRLPKPAQWSAQRGINELAEKIDGVAQAQLQSRGVKLQELSEEERRRAIAPAVDQVMADYAAQMTPRQWALAFGILAGMIGIGGLWLPLQAPMSSLAGPLIGAAWWKWNLISGSWGKLIANPPQKILFRDLENEGTRKELSLFLQNMGSLPTTQATEIADRMKDGINILKDAQAALTNYVNLTIHQDPEDAIDSLVRVVKLYQKEWWYVPLDPDHVKLCHNAVKRVIGDEASYRAAADLLKTEVSREAIGTKAEVARQVKAAMELLDALVMPETVRGKAASPTPTAKGCLTQLLHTNYQADQATLSRFTYSLSGTTLS